MEREASEATKETRRTPLPGRVYHLGFLLAAGLASVAIIAWWRSPVDKASAQDRGSVEPSKRLAEVFPQWKKPDLVLVLTGQQHGYLQPCGCSRPQYGGLTRRYNFLQLLKRGGWPVLALDLGDIAQRNGPQTMLKYVTSMKALTLMDYHAVGIGENELGLTLLGALGHYRLNNPSPKVLAANLVNKEKDQPFNGLVDSWSVVAAKGQPRVGVLGTVGQSVMDKVRDPDAKFVGNDKALFPLVGPLAKKTDLLVLLYQGSLKEAQKVAGAYPSFDVILCLSEEEEPPSLPDRVGKTSIVTIGHKGRYVGAVGVYRTGNKKKPFELRYQLVALGEEFDTPKGQEAGHPVMKVIEDYARKVKEANLLAEAAKQQVSHPLQLAYPKSTFVGSESCKGCHGKAFKTWAASPHFHAYDSLVKAKHPSLRQFDTECIKCHVTGWGYKGGFTSEQLTPLLKANGCENCHGPASEHVRLRKLDQPLNKVDAKMDQDIRKLINPHRFDPKEGKLARVRRLNQIGYSCQKCHDIENDVKWDPDKWWKIVHSGDKK